MLLEEYYLKLSKRYKHYRIRGWEYMNFNFLMLFCPTLMFDEHCTLAVLSKSYMCLGQDWNPQPSIF